MGVDRLYPWMQSVYSLRSGAAAAAAMGAAVSVTVVPCDHLEWQPPPSTPRSAAWSRVRNEKIRDPESSAGMKSAPHTPQRVSLSDRAGRSEIVTLAMRHRINAGPRDKKGKARAGRPHMRQQHTIGRHDERDSCVRIAAVDLEIRHLRLVAGIADAGSMT